MKTMYFSFGQSHVHSMDGFTYDKDVLVKIRASDPRQRMFQLFGRRWAMQYDEPPDPEFYSRGIKEIDAPEMFSMMVCRDYMDDEFEVLIEILDYIPEHQGGCHDERLASSVEMGDAFTLDGKQIELTPLEQERAAEGALQMIESREKDS